MADQNIPNDELSRASQLQEKIAKQQQEINNNFAKAKSYASQFHVNEEKAEVVERFIKSKRRILNLTQEYIESFDSYDEAYGETMNSMNPNTGLDC